MQIIVVGAGAWGTALAVSAAKRHAVRLCARSEAAAAALRQDGENRAYLAGVALPAALQLGVATTHAKHIGALQVADLLVLATPAKAVPEWLAAAALAKLRIPIVWLSKGLVHSPSGTPELLHEAAARIAPALQVGVLSGPSFAQEVAAGLPCALVAASLHASVRDALAEAFHCANMRVYGNDDVAGVELGGAVKNVLAIAAGVCDGLHLGTNARAALVTRGLAEMARLGAAMGARADTFMGLSGLGDLVLTTTGDLSRNRRVGLLLAQGMSVADAVASLGHVAEGVSAAAAIFQRSQSLDVPMPMVHAVHKLLQGEQSATQAVHALMSRAATTE